MKQLIFLIIVFFSCHLWQLGFGQSNLTDQTSVKAHQQLLSNQSSLMYGDSNCDGQLDILDVVATINHILGLNPDPYCIHLADLNADGEINILDVVFTINLILEVPGLPCPGMPTITDFDGNIYNTVLIGEQCWMKENLITTHFNNGIPVENITDYFDWFSNIIGAYSWYNNDISWKECYGALYNWYAVNSANGICPIGWHVPTDDEFTALTDYLGGTNLAGGKMKSMRATPEPHPRWESPNTEATNESNWSAYPGGYRVSLGSFYDLGSHGYWWSSTENSSTTAWYRYMYHSSSSVFRYSYTKNGGLSIRCLRD